MIVREGSIALTCVMSEAQALSKVDNVFAFDASSSWFGSPTNSNDAILASPLKSVATCFQSFTHAVEP